MQTAGSSSYDVSGLIPRGIGGRDALQVTGDVGTISSVSGWQQVLYDINWTDDPELPRVLLEGAAINLFSVKGPITLSMPTAERLPACESDRWAPPCCPTVIPDERYRYLIAGPLVGAEVHGVGRSMAIIESNCPQLSSVRAPLDVLALSPSAIQSEPSSRGPP